MTMTKFTEDNLKEANERCIEAQNQIDEENKKVLEEVKSKVSKESFEDIEHIIKESEYTSDYLLTDEPKGEYQEEKEYEVIKGYHVNQTTNGGFTGDEYAGTMSIQISDDEYFQFNYSM